MTTEPTAAPLIGLAATAPSAREIVTRRGEHLSVRPASSADEPALEALFERVAAEDRRFRFLSAQAHVGAEMLAPMTHCDHFRSENFLAFDPANGELVATAMLACDDPLDTGEIAVSVRSDWRGRGVGWALLDLIAEEAAKRGLRRVISIEDRANHAAIELEREKGFVARAVEGDATLVMLEKVLR